MNENAEKTEAVLFKCEASLWDMMAEVNPDGRSVKPFNMRRWITSDERIDRLQWGHYGEGTYGSRGPTVQMEAPPAEIVTRIVERRGWGWVPDEKEVSFVNKATGELLTFEYLGVEFADWAPGWGFLILGKRLAPPVEEE